MEISIAAEKIFEIWGFPVTNSMLLSLVVLIFLSILVYFGTRKLEEVPKSHSMQNVLEMAIEKLLGLVDSVTKDRKLSMKIFPILATFFIFILFNNWFGILPGVGSIGIHETVHGKEVFIPIFRAGTADLNTTIMLGILVVIATQVIGIVTLGFFRYGKKFINFSDPVKFFIGLIELASELIRIISFAFRLFGNVFAGEVLLIILAALAPFVAPIPFYIMELFVGFIQALVFTMLALVFMTMATASHDHPKEHTEAEEIERERAAEERQAEAN
jgi:F-type H+-transporting ATPase subunit a